MHDLRQTSNMTRPRTCANPFGAALSNAAVMTRNGPTTGQTARVMGREWCSTVWNFHTLAPPRCGVRYRSFCIRCGVSFTLTCLTLQKDLLSLLLRYQIDVDVARWDNSASEAILQLFLKRAQWIGTAIALRIWHFCLLCPHCS